jgi:hypothetical protein
MKNSASDLNVMQSKPCAIFSCTSLIEYVLQQASLPCVRQAANVRAIAAR